MLLMQGCLLNNRGHAKARDELSSAIVNVLNPEILRFSGCGHGNSRYDPEDLIEYNLMIESINSTELAEQERIFMLLLTKFLDMRVTVIKELG